MILSFTGHRPDKLGGYECHPKLVALATDLLLLAEPERCIVGMALGWDMAVACACDNIGIPFTAAVPFAGQERLWPEPAQNMYHNLLRSQLCQPKVLYAGGYSAGKMSLRNGWMVDNSDAVVALWNGTPGGTGNCVRYARIKKKPILNLWPAYATELTVSPPSVSQLLSEFYNAHAPLNGH